MPEAAAAPAIPATPPPVSAADQQRALIARENGTTYDANSQTFNEPAAPAADGTTPVTPASGEPAQNAPEGADANSEAQTQDTTPVEGGGDETDDPATEGQQEPSQQPAGKNGVARKIDKLTRRNAELERTLAALAQRMQMPQAQQPQQPQPQAQQPADPQPDPAKYTDVSKFLSDTAAWQSRQETQRVLGQVFGHLAQQQAQQQRAQQAAQQVQEFNSRVVDGAKGIKDFAEVTSANADVEVAPHVAASLMQGVENPAVVLYHLAKNPDEVAKLNTLPPAKVAVRLGQIEANAKRPPQISNAPRPGTPVAAKGNVPTGYSDDMTTEQFMAWRKTQK